MSLSKLAVNSKNLSSLTSELNAGTYFGSNKDDAFDKNNKNSMAALSELVDVAKDWSSEIANALGYRAPMYTIGEIPSELSEDIAKWVPGELGGAVRAVSNIFEANEQDGVIIDGIGDFSGKFDMELPKNSMLYRASGITDQRVRTPSICKMRVYVSNHLSNDLLGTALNQISALDPTGLLGGVANNILYENGSTRAQNALYKLRWIQENGKPFKVYTPHCVFERMIIKDIEITTDETLMDTLCADITFTELLMYAPLSSIANVAKRESVVNPESKTWFGKAKDWIAK